MKSKKYIYLLVIFLSITLIAVVYIVFSTINQRRASALIENVQEVAHSTPIQTIVYTRSVVEEEIEEEYELIENPLNWDELYAINPDIHAWIEVPGTPIDYPVLQSQEDEDQEFYLHHTVERTAFIGGSVFTQDFNNRDFSDVNTLVYAHSAMRDGSMFTRLKNFLEPEFSEEFDTFTIITPNRILEYRIVVAVVYDDRHIMDSYDFEDEEQFQDFIDSLFLQNNSANWIDSEALTTERQIVTLSTCYGRSGGGLRLLIIGILETEFHTY